MQPRNPGQNTLTQKWLPPFVYGFLLLSPFSISIFNYGKHYIFEIPLVISIIFGLIMRDELYISALSAIRLTRKSLLFVSIVTLAFLIGWMNTGNFGDAYGDYRAGIVMLAGFAITKYAVTKNGGLWLTRLGLVCAILYVFFFLKSAAFTADYLKFPSSYLALTVAAVIACWNKKVTIAEIAVLLQIFLAAISFYRQYWIATLFTALFVSSYMLFKRKSVARRSWLHIFALFIIGILPIYLFFNNQIANFFEQSAHYGQLFGKTIAFFDYAANSTSHYKTSDRSDALRFAYLSFLYLHPASLIIPHGLGTTAVYGKIFPWYFVGYGIKANVIDSLIFFIAYCYGIIAAILVLVWLIMRYYVYILRRGLIEASLLFLLLILILAFDGGQITVILDSFWLGAFVALLSIPPPRIST